MHSTSPGFGGDQEETLVREGVGEWETDCRGREARFKALGLSRRVCEETLGIHLGNRKGDKMV